MSAVEILLLFGLIGIGTFLILVVLVQRGRGGGLTGALGGMGGQSAFGTKAGDTFTKITIWTVVVWILLCVVAVKYLSSSREDALGDKGSNSGPPTVKVPGDAPADQTKPDVPAAAEKTGATTPAEDPNATPPPSPKPTTPEPPSPAPPTESK